MTENQTDADRSRQRRRVLLGLVASFALASILLISIVLPAETGYDPLGIGGALGLAGLSIENDATRNRKGWGQSSAPDSVEHNALQHDHIDFELAPFESVEYKYHLRSDDALLYTWYAAGDVTYDFHADPSQDDLQAPSYDRGKSQGRVGSFEAAFDGLHGWYFENRNMETVTVALRTSGFYERATLFRDGGSYERDLVEKSR